MQRRAGGEPVRTDRPPRHAVVLGGGIAGLLAAHVLTVYADTVTVVERDRYPDEPVPRAGVPQGHHIHALIAGAHRPLDALLPGITDELVERGAVRIGQPADVVQWQGAWTRRFPASHEVLSASRPLIEDQVRKRVLGASRRQITVLEGTEAVGLTGTADRVRGVTVRERESGESREIAADLVVDASGRDSHAFRWLTDLGAEPPIEELVDAGVGYATAIFRPRGAAKDATPEGATPEDAKASDAKDSDAEAGPGRSASDAAGLPYQGVYLVMGPDDPRGGALLPIEGGRWIVTLTGLRGEEPPTDEAGFRAFAAGMPQAVISEVLTGAEIDGPVRGFRGTSNVRRRYERKGRRPAGFLALGDALASFDPIYGQGMAVAARQAVALRDALAGLHRVPTTARVQRALAGAADLAWRVAAGADRSLPGATAGATPLVDRALQGYVRAAVRRRNGDEEVSRAVLEVLTLTGGPSALFAPKVVRRVLTGAEPSTPAAVPLERE
ncbi:hypothetical protein BIV57_13055 [Mangrovactinospora gilvigrisea]|uniref:FAD-binding domain-containing protein n=1 Tax=Mangrovactinospora gilvigrisea TaxID=1428644 RepID=A0A1J7BEU5_9ACTN|nr:hypothetical protein BIV57_13055 [Mangrovactinospora gilvigrisea]